MAESAVHEQSGALNSEIEKSMAKGPYASPGQRCNAFICDVLIMSGVTFALHYLTRRILGWSHVDWYPIDWTLVCLYFLGFELSPIQATPGKRLNGFYVAATDGSRLVWRRVLYRNLLRWVHFVCVFKLPVPLFCQLSFMVIDFLLLVVSANIFQFSHRCQALHDLLAGSAPYRKPLAT
jgi:uncharacterized RDD family membrane protein YckC